MLYLTQLSHKGPKVCVKCGCACVHSMPHSNVREHFHIVYVARGAATLAPTAASILQVAAWAADRSRLRFHLLAGERVLQDLEQKPLSAWLGTAPGSDAASDSELSVQVHDATDAAMSRRLSPLGNAWLQHTNRLTAKTHSYTVPKLFLFELMPPSVDQVITLDTDVVALSDVTRLFLHTRQLAATHKSVGLFFASKQQNKYRWTLNWTRLSRSESSAWPDHRRNGVNGGVGVQFLQRLRNSTTYRTVLRRFLLPDVRSAALIGGTKEKIAATLLGDQTVFSVGAILAPQDWADLMRLLPCAWNWQTCVWSYARVDECPIFEGNIICPPDAPQPPVLHDSSCPLAPRFLHFDCPGELKALLVNSFAPTGANHTDFSRVLGGGAARVDEDGASRAITALDRALKAPRAASMCGRAERRLPGIATARFCNASFLLSRLAWAAVAPAAAARLDRPRAGRGIATGSDGDGRGTAPSDAEGADEVGRLEKEAGHMATARRLFEVESAGPCPRLRSPPRVYVYGLADVPKNPYGVPLDERQHATAASGPTFVNAIHARLFAMRETRPERAEIFYIPEAAANRAALCTTLASRIDAYWAEHGGGVNYFRRRGGADHLTAVHRLVEMMTCHAWQTRPFEKVFKAVGVLQSPWFPESRPLPISPRRLRGKPFVCDPHVHDVCPWLPNTSRAEADRLAASQRIIEVPYGGSVHDPRSWTRTDKRPLLAVASFNSRGHRNFHRQMDVRRTLLSQCRARPERCRTVDLGGRYNLANTDDPQGHKMLLRVLASYRESVFSLQPAGDDPARKGIIDSITCGCIPVVFYEQQQQLWPWHWRAWSTESSVLLPHEAVLNGSLNVLEALAAIPQQRVARMQAAIERSAHRLQYSLHTAAVEGDALEVLLERVRCAQ